MSYKGKDTELRQSAIRYAKLGYRVFPCKERGKEPLIPDWPNKASSDPKQVAEWWTRWPRANIGLLCGEGVVVLDIDPRNGGDWIGLPLPDTLVCETGTRGRHYYFRVSEGAKVPKTKIGDGLDLQGVGSYVIAPPSIHPNGQRYEWLDGGELGETELAPLPDWIVAELRLREVGATKDTYWRHYVDVAIPKGRRNDVLTSYAGHLRRQGLDADAIYTELAKWNERCAPPIPDKELRQIANSMARYPAGRPRAKEADGGGGAPAKRGRPSKAEAAEAALMEARWVRYRNRLYIEHGGALFGVEVAHRYLFLRGVSVSAAMAKERAEAVAFAKASAGDFADISQAVVQLDRAPVYGRAGGLEGIWFRHGGSKWCYTTDGRYVKADGAEVYFVVPAEDDPDTSLPFWPEGEVRDLMYYAALAFHNVVSPSDPRVALAAAAPVLLGLGDAGLLLEGPGGAGKSTSGQMLYYLAYQMLPATAVGDSNRDHLVAIGSRRVVYKDDLRAMDAREETLLRISITGGAAEMRGLYSDAPRRIELAGSAIVCGYDVRFDDPTTIERFVRIEYKAKARERWETLRERIAQAAPKALGGLFRLFAKAAKEPTPDGGDMPEIRLRDWFSWAVRFARVMGVEDAFRRWLTEMSGALFRRMGDWAELYFMLKAGEIGEGVYPLSDLAEKILERLGSSDKERPAVIGSMVRRAQRGGGQILVTICERAGYSVAMAKERESGSRKVRWFIELRPKGMAAIGEADLWAEADRLAAGLDWGAPLPHGADQSISDPVGDLPLIPACMAEAEAAPSPTLASGAPPSEANTTDPALASDGPQRAEASDPPQSDKSWPSLAKGASLPSPAVLKFMAMVSGDSSFLEAVPEAEAEWPQRAAAEAEPPPLRPPEKLDPYWRYALYLEEEAEDLKEFGVCTKRNEAKRRALRDFFLGEGDTIDFAAMRTQLEAWYGPAVRLIERVMREGEAMDNSEWVYWGAALNLLLDFQGKDLERADFLRIQHTAYALTFVEYFIDTWNKSLETPPLLHVLRRGWAALHSQTTESWDMILASAKGYAKDWGGLEGGSVGHAAWLVWRTAEYARVLRTDPNPPPPYSMYLPPFNVFDPEAWKAEETV